ncbi:MAG: hydrogenase maturation protease [Candidatus Nanoarchaeia archaeon]|nr:hydrogenase maturation protease [Candidatus Nanoarchaeia archaeon]MDD5499368.1 hydrogenase maturation protease [Candidatus Nanoarchaeia archaeon]
MKIIALGNELRKDDGIALILASDLGAVKAFTNPENFINPGEEVIVVDAVDFGDKPGSVKEFSCKDICEFAISTTHNCNVSVLEKLCKIKKIIGIQPKDTGYGKGLSGELSEKKPEILSNIKKLLNF